MINLIENKLVVQNITWKFDKTSDDFHEFLKMTSQDLKNSGQRHKTRAEIDLIANSSYWEHQEESGLVSRACFLFSLVVTILSILGFISICCYGG